MAGPRALVVAAAVGAATAIAAVWLAPATLVDGEIARMTGGRLRLAAADGTLWRGRANLVAGATAIPVAWRIDPWSLLHRDLRIRLEPMAGDAARTPRADVAFDGARTVLRDVDVAVPAAALASALPSTAADRIGGELGIVSGALEWGPSSIRGVARLQWRAARVLPADRGTSVDLGDVSATLEGSGAELAGPVTNAGGDVAVRGRIVVRANEALLLTATLAPRAAPDPALARALSAIAAPDGAGWRIDARLPLR